MLLLLTALSFLCSGSGLGSLGGGREPAASRTHIEGLAARADPARELAAKLSSLNSVVRVGLGLVLLGLLSLAYPPFRALVHGGSSRVALVLGGLGLIVLPTLVVGNERLILGALVLGLGAWRLSNRAFRKHERTERQVGPTISAPGLAKNSPPYLHRGR